MSGTESGYKQSIDPGLPGYRSLMYCTVSKLESVHSEISEIKSGHILKYEILSKEREGNIRK
jgi:hypothetical protein